ncbi:hypothetical protein [Methylobacterium sp. Leaf118]|uniref:hypothetical protein n=1 Tax=Methylobacterium sp. Leaf118 TaxID=2876562 RepID=UPI001E4D4A4B|nr:hypothetical protein [Methylobacterium sp. Leaf118]
MSSSRSLTPQDASQYDQIEAAVRETERGRWFLTEYARRNRNADTDMLLGAIQRIESAVTGERGGDDVVRFRGDLMDMADAIARTRAEVAALSAPDQGESRLTVASEALDSIVRATERATSDILGAAEEVQEAAWTLRETGADGEICDALDRHATQIYTACSFQDLTAQRTSRIVHTLRYLEDRIASMIGIWGGADDAVPPLDGDGRVRKESAPVLDAALDQSDVDRFLDMENPAPPPPQTRPSLAAVPLHDDIAFLPESPAFTAAPFVPMDDESPAAALEAPETALEALAPFEAEEASVIAGAMEDETPSAQPLRDLDLDFATAEAAAETTEAPADVFFDAETDTAETDTAETFAAEAQDAETDVAETDVAETHDAETAVALADPDTDARVDGSEPVEAAEVQFARLATEPRTQTRAPDDLAAAFPDLDRLSIEEKIALFA